MMCSRSSKLLLGRVEPLEHFADFLEQVPPVSLATFSGVTPGCVSNDRTAASTSRTVLP